MRCGAPGVGSDCLPELLRSALVRPLQEKCAAAIDMGRCLPLMPLHELDVLERSRRGYGASAARARIAQQLEVIPAVAAVLAREEFAPYAFDGGSDVRMATELGRLRQVIARQVELSEFAVRPRTERTD